MGAFVVYQAYQGYRRNDRRQMLILTLGGGLITVVPPLVTIIVTSIGLQINLSIIVYPYHVPLAENVIRIIGLGCIIYSLVLPSES